MILVLLFVLTLEVILAQVVSLSPATVPWDHLHLGQWYWKRCISDAFSKSLRLLPVDFIDFSGVKPCGLYSFQANILKNPLPLNILMCFSKGNPPQNALSSVLGIIHPWSFYMAPEKWWWLEYFPFGITISQGACLNFQGIVICPSLTAKTGQSRSTNLQEVFLFRTAPAVAHRASTVLQNFWLKPCPHGQVESMLWMSWHKTLQRWKLERGHLIL